MNRLLKIGFFRLFRSKLFYILLAFCMAFGAYFQLQHYNDSLCGSPCKLENGFFSYVLLIPLLLSAFIPLSIGTDYSDGTIRNKLVIGQKRTVVYLSNLIVYSVSSILFCMAYLISSLGLGIPLNGFFTCELTQIIYFILASFLLMIVFSAISVCISMLISNRAYAAVVSILIIFLLLFAGAYLEAKLSAPEFYDGYVYISEDGKMTEGIKEPNSGYLRGTERKVYEVLYDIVPGGQVEQISFMKAPRLDLMAVYDIIILITVTGMGLWIFKKKDLK